MLFVLSVPCDIDVDAVVIYVILQDKLIIRYNILANRTNIQRRFQLLDTLLKWEGELSNGRIRDLLGVQIVQVSRLLSEYRDTHPARMVWEPSRKRYMRQPSRERYGGTVEDYLRILDEEGSQSAWIERIDTNISSVAPNVLIAMRQAIEAGRPVRILYTSMTNPTGAERDIFPGHIVQAGRRWHVRAWCCARQEYRDFVLGRIRRISKSSVLAKPEVVDDAWETMVDVRLVPHRDLSTAQAKVIRDELFDGTMARRIRTHGCLVPYVVQDIRASVSPNQAPPDYQVEISNLDEIGKYLFPK